jgi:L-asparaginase
MDGKSAVEKKIKIYSLGGTIDKVYFDRMSRYEVGEPIIGEILRKANISPQYTIVSFCRKDSLDMTDDDRRALADRIRTDRTRRILITHGTDTMIETARSLMGIPDKTIVLTGAMTPARFQESDAPFNIGYAVAAVQTLPAGVYIAMNGRIWDPTRSRKNRDRNRFEDA